MKNQRDKVISILAVTFAAVVSCADPMNETPYIVSTPVSKCTPSPGNYEHAGIEFDFFNTTDKDIKSVTVSCYVYSATDKTNPLSISNKVEAIFTEIIPSQSEKRLSINLDSRLYYIPDKPFIVDFFTIPKIGFSDGTVWEDKTCQFFTRSY